MKKQIKFLVVIAAIVISGLSMKADAQFRFGLRAGVNVSTLHFNNSIFDSSNRAGFTGGIITEFTMPVVGIGFDASLMYVRRNQPWFEENIATEKVGRDYIDLPINLKWKMNIPVINAIARPFLTTGPVFSLMTGSKNYMEDVKGRRFDTAWSFGAGVELLKHLQVSASYGLGLTKALKTTGATSTANIEGHNRYWTVTAAYLF